MHLYRAALQRFSPLVRPSITHLAILHRDVVPRRLMSSVPGGTGENLVYLVLCGGAFAGAVTYTYKTVTTDSARFTDRITEIEARPKNEWKPKPWPPKNAEEAEEAAGPPVAEAPVAEAPVAGPPVAEAPVAEAPVAEPPVAEPPVAEPPAEAATEEATPVPMELVAEVKAENSESVVEKTVETAAEAPEGVVEVNCVVKETAEVVEAVAFEVEKIVEEVEAAAKMLEAHALPVVEEASTENHVKEATLQEEVVTLSDTTH